MEFPDLRLLDDELESHARIARAFCEKIASFIERTYRIRLNVKCSGSTERGTALPARFFGTDIDLTVLVDDVVLDQLAYRSGLFEGCQLISIEFAASFDKAFGCTYSGHKLSGTFMGYPYDFSFTDKNKDSWKWDMNSSHHMRLDERERAEISRYGSNPAGLESSLRTAMKGIIKDSAAIDLHRRSVSCSPLVESVEITIEPPERCHAAASLVTKFKAGLNDPNRPIGVFLFCGPTGVGKTELAKAMSRFFFGHGTKENRLVRLDMSEYAHPGAAERLLCNTDGEPGELIKRIRQQPFAVVLLDEIEKASPEVFDVLLNLLDEGRLADQGTRGVQQGTSGYRGPA